MTRITSQMKDAFVCKLLAKTFNEDLEKSKEAILESDLYKDIHRALIPKKLNDELLKNPMFFPLKEGRVTINYYKGFCGYVSFDFSDLNLANVGGSLGGEFTSIQVHFDNKGVRINVDSAVGKGPLIKGEIFSPVIKKYERMISDYCSLRIQHEKFKITLEDALKGVRTVKGLKALSPEISEAWDQIMGEEGKEKSLPAIIPTNINNLIKSKMPFSEEAATA